MTPLPLVRGPERTARSLARLAGAVDRCAALAADPDRLAVSDSEVSGWSIAQHVEHLVLADLGILEWIHGVLDDPEHGHREGRPSGVGRLVLLTGWIPRGRGKAPDGTRPEAIDPERLRDLLADATGLIDGLEGRVEEIAGLERTRRHPILGDFTPAQWLRFLAVHHRHHDKIMRDIDE